MEGVSATVYKGLRRYWNRKGYERLDGSGRRRRKRLEVATMGGGGGGSSSTGSGRRRRFWRFKIKPKLRFWSMSSPKNFFVKLRDAYVKMMLGLANSRVISTGYGGTVGEFGGFGGRALKEYDEKMIVEIYKSIVLAQGQIVPRDAARLGSEIR